MNFGHFTNVKKDTNKYKTLGQPNPARDQLAKAGMCFKCKNPVHVARDYPTRKISSTY